MRQRACAVVLSGDRLMFVQQKVNGQIRRVFIGGGIEEGETPEQAILREIREEANVDAEVLFGPVIIEETVHINHFFVVDIGSQAVTLGYDPELPPDRQELKGIIWENIADGHRIFNEIDMKFISKVFESAKQNSMSTSWLKKLSRAAGLV